MARPSVAMLIIGDELLAGRTQDANLAHTAGVLAEAGFALVEARFIPDSHDGIVETLRALSTKADHVFTSGGIGPTHDDITAEAVAAAHGVPLSVREDARAILAAHYAAKGAPLTEARLRMARIPEGAVLIDNPISAAPGFSVTTALGQTHVMAGVPRIYQAMLAGLLSRLQGGAPQSVAKLVVYRGESDIAPPLAQFAADHPDLSIGSYPFEGARGYGAELVIRGDDPQAVQAAQHSLAALFEVGLDG